MKQVTYEADIGSGADSIEVDDIEIAKSESAVVSDSQAKRLQALSGVRVKVEDHTEKKGA